MGGCPRAAAELGVSERRARQLVAGGLLTGTKVGGKWLIDRDDVARLAGDRRLTA
ncbi:helix-turn-helix domain-containing protein [Cellulosimicrobium sp. KWT-B]|uniref:helix-turn-helix domain-containing protein n=1 Tax=Cellulosimicrobium sp. KWT-B TaxID=1981152 RepID=UPI0013029A47